MAGLCEGGNEPAGSLKAICKSALEIKGKEIGKEIPPPMSFPLHRFRKEHVVKNYASVVDFRRPFYNVVIFYNDEVRSEDSPKDYPAFAFWFGKTSEKPNQTIRLQSHGWEKPRKKPFIETKGGSNPSPNAAPDQQPSESAD
ncbi:hypothetical protein ANN_24554 [Periplaneta americana]|uniref:Per a allergen n=1 Tax=Periplaneta americana TaxID=6978 RepID=A0ABQ8S3P0_PERAM|nr:hypothetical protein ANN_24554 [Periplaneta americana]